MSAMTIAPTLRRAGHRRAAAQRAAARRAAGPVAPLRAVPALPGPVAGGPVPVRAAAPGRAVPVAGPRREVTAGPLRLTRRGRVVMWSLGVLLASGVGGAAMSAQADGPTAAAEVRRVVVAPGDTLWGIAAGVAAPGEDVRDVVLQLMTLNELPSGGLLAGQTIVVPAE